MNEGLTGFNLEYVEGSKQLDLVNLQISPTAVFWQCINYYTINKKL